VTTLPFHPVDQRPNGCYLACLASLTGLPLDVFPEPPPAGDCREECRWKNAVTDLLGQHGWAAVSLGSRIPLEGYAIGSGPSPRHEGADIWHSIVLLDGMPHFDPHPTRAMLGDSVPAEYELVIRVRPYRLPSSALEGPAT
jgi:hypothetical protein